MITWNQASLLSPFSASPVRGLTNFYIIAVQVGVIKRDRMLLWGCTYLGISWKKTNMAEVNMSKFK